MKQTLLKSCVSLAVLSVASVAMPAFAADQAAAAPAAALNDEDEDVEAATPAGHTTPHHAATPRSLRGVDLSHVRCMAASAPALLDRFDSYKRPGDTPAPPTAPHSAQQRRGVEATPSPFESFKFSGGAKRTRE